MSAVARGHPHTLSYFQQRELLRRIVRCYVMHCCERQASEAM